MHRNIKYLFLCKFCASHSRYFSDELDAQNLHQKKEQMFDIFLCIWYTILRRKICLQLIKMVFPMVEDMCTLQYHLVWCTKYRKYFKRFELMWNAKKCWKVLHRNINFKSWLWRLGAGSYSSACRLSTTVLYFRHDQNHEGILRARCLCIQS